MKSERVHNMDSFFWTVSLTIVADAGSGAFLTSGSGSEWKKIILLKLSNTFFGLSIHKFFCCGSGIFSTQNPESGMEKFGSGINIPDLQHGQSLES
jgi:hypothetical protein